MTKLIITGSRGRMGQTLIACAAQHPELQVVGQIDQGDDLGTVLEKADVVIDFSSHDATLALATLCAKNKKPIVIGTTGQTEQERSQIAELGSQIPMVWSSNF